MRKRWETACNACLRGDFAFAETEKSFEIFSLPVDLQWFFDDVRRRYHNPIEQGLKLTVDYTDKTGEPGADITIQ